MGLLAMGLACWEERGSTLSSLGKRRRLSWFKNTCGWRKGVSSAALGSNPSCTICYSIPCASHLNPLGISFFSVYMRIVVVFG